MPKVIIRQTAPTPCADATVENSNQSYSDTVASGGTLVLPDITVTDSDGSTFTQPAVENVTCALAQAVDIDINGTTEGSVASGNTAEINIVNQDSNPVTISSVGVVGDVYTVNVTEPRILNNYYDVLDTTVTIPLRTVKATEAGTITSINAGGLTSLVIEVNGVPASVPFALVAGDTLEFFYDAATADTEITLTGTYV
jgi:hypothetical protein